MGRLLCLIGKHRMDEEHTREYSDLWTPGRIMVVKTRACLRNGCIALDRQYSIKGQS